MESIISCYCEVDDHKVERRSDQRDPSGSSTLDVETLRIENESESDGESDEESDRVNKEELPTCVGKKRERKETESKCEICHSQEWKYKCPRCTVHFCSVVCSRSHKETDDCSGKPKKSFHSFTPISQMGEKDLQDGFYFPLSLS